MEFDSSMHGYLWLSLGLLLGLIELMLGTYFLLALAGGALLTGLFSLISPMTWTFEVMLFAVFCVVSLGVLLHWKRKQSVTDQPVDDITRMHGQRVTVVVRTAPEGRVRYKGVDWKAESECPIDVGETAIIERVNGSTLYIKEHAST